jgi:hypothetical protein
MKLIDALKPEISKLTPVQLTHCLQATNGAAIGQEDTTDRNMYASKYPLRSDDTTYTRVATVNDRDFKFDVFVATLPDGYQHLFFGHWNDGVAPQPQTD